MSSSLSGEITNTRAKTKRNVRLFHVGRRRKSLHSSAESILMAERALSSLGTNNIEQFTNKLCCITLTQTRKDRSLNIGHLLQTNNQTQNLNCRKHHRKNIENPFTSKSYSQNDKDPSLLTADKEENPPDLHPSGVSSAAGGSRDLAEMEEPDINADSSSNYLHNITTDHLQTKYSELKSCHGESTQSTPQPVLATQLPGNPSPVVVLRSIACYGKISNQLGDLQVWDPEFKIPEDIQERLITKHRHTHDIGVGIIRNIDGTLECHDHQDFKRFFLDDDVELAKDEFLVLKTRIRHGKVSLNDVDVQFKFGNVHIPQEIVYGFTEKVSADLYIISGTERKFRVIVKGESASKRVTEFMNRKLNFFSSRSLYNF